MDKEDSYIILIFDMFFFVDFYYWINFVNMIFIVFDRIFYLEIGR